jgi:hypothetical protein
MDTFSEAFENIVRVDVAHEWGRLFLDAWAVYFVFLFNSSGVNCSEYTAEGLLIFL